MSSVPKAALWNEDALWNPATSPPRPPAPKQKQKQKSETGTSKQTTTNKMKKGRSAECRGAHFRQKGSRSIPTLVLFDRFHASCQWNDAELRGKEKPTVPQQWTNEATKRLPLPQVLGQVFPCRGKVLEHSLPKREVGKSHAQPPSGVTRHLRSQRRCSEARPLATHVAPDKPSLVGCFWESDKIGHQKGLGGPDVPLSGQNSFATCYALPFVWTCHFDVPVFFLGKWENSCFFLKRTMVEQNGFGINSQAFCETRSTFWPCSDGGVAGGLCGPALPQPL